MGAHYEENLLQCFKKAISMVTYRNIVANIKIHTDASVGVAEHSDHLETIEKELSIIAEYEDKLEVLKKYFGNGDKEVLNG